MQWLLGENGDRSLHMQWLLGQNGDRILRFFELVCFVGGTYPVSGCIHLKDLFGWKTESFVT